MRSFNRALGRFASFGPLLTRVVLGALFILHGVDKFRTGLDNVEGFFASNGVPLSGLTAPLTAVLEITLGAAVMLGLFTRLAALVLTALLIGAIIWVKAPTILGGSEVDLAYISGLLALVALGPGRFSIDEAINTDDTVIDLRSHSGATPMRAGASVNI